MRPETTPVQIGQEGAEQLRVEWKDGHKSLYPVRGLRLACRCAACVEEMTGRPLLREEEVPENVRPKRISPVGRYGIQIAWTDGHDTGIYTFEYLRMLDAEAPARENA
jgi:ATP-binding protein involved in chromosome partitioning